MRISPVLSLWRWSLAVLVAVSAGALIWQTALADNIIYVVQPNENLFRIGLKFGVSWTAIMQANGLTSTTIYAGEQLIIPVDGTVDAAPQTPAVAATAAATPAAPTPAAVTPVASPPAAVTAAAPSAATSYVVQTGDTLSQIAARFGSSVAGIAAANSIYNASYIYAGQTLTIPSAPAAPGPDAALPKQIIVSLSQQHLYAYENGTQVFSFVASTGMRGSQTRAGSFNVLDKIPSAYGANWNIWMPNWLGIYWAGNLEDGIHALPILSNGQRLWDGYLGAPISYGCVVLGVADAQTLYDWAEVGTPVIIQP